MSILNTTPSKIDQARFIVYVQDDLSILPSKNNSRVKNLVEKNNATTISNRYRLAIQVLQKSNRKIPVI